MIYRVYFKYDDGIWVKKAIAKVEAKNEKEAIKKARIEIQQTLGMAFTNSVSTSVKVKELKQKIKK